MSEASGRSPQSLVFVTSLAGWGGGEKWMLDAAAAMAARGHRTTLVCRRGSEIGRRAAGGAFPVREIVMGGWLDPRTLVPLAGILRRDRPAAVCVNIDKEIRQVALARLATAGFRIVARRGSPVPIKDTWHYRLAYERGVDRLILNCRALEEKVCGRAPWFDRGRLRVIHNACDADALAAAARPGRLRGELGIGPGRPVVTLVGEVGRRKGQDVLLAAAPALAREHPGAVFVFAGEGDGLARLREETRSRGLDDGTVRWLGFRRDVADILVDSDVVVLPSREEGFPNSLLEAMALGRPVVATTVDGIPELVVDGETGRLVAPDDFEAFAAAVGTLLGDAELRRTWGEAGRRRVREEFSPRRQHDLLEDCLTAWG